MARFSGANVTISRISRASSWRLVARRPEVARAHPAGQSRAAPSRCRRRARAASSACASMSVARIVSVPVRAVGQQAVEQHRQRVRLLRRGAAGAPERRAAASPAARRCGDQPRQDALVERREERRVAEEVALADRQRADQRAPLGRRWSAARAASPAARAGRSADAASARSRSAPRRAGNVEPEPVARPARGRPRGGRPGASARRPRERRGDGIVLAAATGTRRGRRSTSTPSGERRDPGHGGRHRLGRPGRSPRPRPSITPSTSSTGSATRRAAGARQQQPARRRRGQRGRTPDPHVEVQHRHDLAVHVDRPAHARPATAAAGTPRPSPTTRSTDVSGSAQRCPPTIDGDQFDDVSSLRHRDRARRIPRSCRPCPRRI